MSEPLITPASLRSSLLLLGCDPGGNVMTRYEQLAEEFKFDLAGFMIQAGKDANAMEFTTPNVRHRTAYSLLKGHIVFHLTQVLNLTSLPYVP